MPASRSIPLPGALPFSIKPPTADALRRRVDPIDTKRDAGHRHRSQLAYPE